MHPVVEHHPERIYRITRADWARMIEAGVFVGRRAELIRGVIVETSPQNNPHSWAIVTLNRILVLALADRAEVRPQLPLIAVDESEPEPDLAIVPHVPRRREHPRSAHLVIEVSDSTLGYDRTTKAELYAESGFPEYWIVNVEAEQLEVYDRPKGRQYTRRRTFGRGRSVAIAAFPDVRVPVDDVLP